MVVDSHLGAQRVVHYGSKHLERHLPETTLVQLDLVEGKNKNNKKQRLQLCRVKLPASSKTHECTAHKIIGELLPGKNHLKVARRHGDFCVGLEFPRLLSDARNPIVHTQRDSRLPRRAPHVAPGRCSGRRLAHRSAACLVLWMQAPGAPSP